MKTPDDPLFRSLLREHRARIRLRPLALFLLTATLSLAAQSLLLPLFFRGNAAGLFHTQLAAAVLFLAAGAAAAGFSSFGAGAGAGAGAALGLGERSILPRNFGCGISSFTLMTLLLMTTSFSSSRSCFLASSRVMVVCFREIRSRIVSRALAALRFAPNSFSRTAYVAASTSVLGDPSLFMPFFCRKSVMVFSPTLNSFAT